MTGGHEAPDGEAPYAVDADGFLRDYRQWTEVAAVQLATAENITLEAAHWQVIFAARRYYARYQRSPDTRPLIKWLRAELGEDFGSSVALMQLFPDQPARRVSKIAGLPKPPNCL